MLANRLTQVMGIDVTAEAARVAVPILYLRAKRDRLLAAASLEVVRRSFSHVEVAQLDGPHLLLQRHPVAAADALTAFCAKVGVTLGGRLKSGRRVLPSLARSVLFAVDPLFLGAAHWG